MKFIKKIIYRIIFPFIAIILLICFLNLIRIENYKKAINNLFVAYENHNFKQKMDSIVPQDIQTLYYRRLEYESNGLYFNEGQENFFNMTKQIDSVEWEIIDIENINHLDKLKNESILNLYVSDWSNLELKLISLYGRYGFKQKNITDANIVKLNTKFFYTNKEIKEKTIYLAVYKYNRKWCVYYPDTLYKN